MDCPSCQESFDERELITESKTVESCPKCRKPVRESSGFAGTNFAAIIADDISTIDGWLDTYSTEMSLAVTKRDSNNDGKFRWAVGTNHDFALECLYDEKHTRFVSVRALTKDHTAVMTKRLASLTIAGAKFGVQPCGERQSAWDISDGSNSDGYWGMVQHLSVHTLGTELLNVVTDRLASCMNNAIGEIIGDGDN